MAIRMFLALVMLSYTAWRDIKTREVHDINWIIFGGVGITLNLFQIATGKLNFAILAISIGFSTIFSLIVWYLELFGEADLLAVIVLSLVQPQAPILIKPLLFPTLIFPLSVLTNSALIGTFSALLIFLKNLVWYISKGSLFKGFESVSVLKKIGIILTGYKIKPDKFKGPPFQYPLQIKYLDLIWMMKKQ
jgi:hypothetical protein